MKILKSSGKKEDNFARASKASRLFWSLLLPLIFASCTSFEQPVLAKSKKLSQPEGSEKELSTKQLSVHKEGHKVDQKLPPREGGLGEIKLIKKIVARYKKSSAVSMKVKKEVYIEMMEETKKSQGSLDLSKGRLRLSLEKPEKSLMLLTDNTIWIENHLPEDFGGGIQVTQIAASKKLKKSNALLAFLFDDIEVWDNFEVIDQDKKGSIVIYDLKPLKMEDLAEVTRIRVKLEQKKKLLEGITYWDQLGNKTSYDFSKVNFSAKHSKKLFEYKPPKNSEVTKM